jgi:hypothetical protein
MPKYTILITGEGNLRNGLPTDADALAQQLGNDLIAVGHTGVQVEIEIDGGKPAPAPEAE